MRVQQKPTSEHFLLYLFERISNQPQELVSGRLKHLLPLFELFHRIATFLGQRGSLVVAIDAARFSPVVVGCMAGRLAG